MRLLRRVLPAALLVAGLTGPVLAQSTDPSFRLNNRTQVAINEVYVSSSASGAWGSDRLGTNVLPPGQSLTIRLPNGQCVNDIRVVYPDGRSQEWMRQNTCAVTDINIQ